MRGGGGGAGWGQLLRTSHQVGARAATARDETWDLVARLVEHRRHESLPQLWPRLLRRDGEHRVRRARVRQPRGHSHTLNQQATHTIQYCLRKLAINSTTRVCFLASVKQQCYCVLPLTTLGVQPTTNGGS